MDTVLITGTTSGIGKAFAEQFAANGSNIILVSRNEETLRQQQESLRSRYHVQVAAIPCDLSEANAADRILERLSQLDWPVDILVNNAGFNAWIRADFECGVYGVLYAVPL